MLNKARRITLLLAGQPPVNAASVVVEGQRERRDSVQTATNHGEFAAEVEPLPSGACEFSHPHAAGAARRRAGTFREQPGTCPNVARRRCECDLLLFSYVHVVCRYDPERNVVGHWRLDGVMRRTFFGRQLYRLSNELFSSFSFFERLSFGSATLNMLKCILIADCQCTGSLKWILSSEMGNVMCPRFILVSFYFVLR